MMRSRRGFTLLEMLTVAAMIAVLVLVALPSYLKTVERGRQTEAKMVLALIRASELRYEAEHQIFTATWDDLDIEDPTPQSAHFIYTLVSADANNFQASALPSRPSPSYRLVVDRSGNIDEVVLGILGTTPPP